MLISHHPSCERFSHHVVKVGKHHVCMGCLFVYPSALVTILAILMVRLYLVLPFVQVVVLASVTFAIAVARRYLWKGLRNKAVHLLFRLVLGVSLGCAVMGIVLATTVVLRADLAVALVVGWMAYQLGGYFSMKAECRSCPGYRSFPRCDGVKRGLDKLGGPANA